MQKIIFELSVQDANVAVQLELLRSNLRDISKELKGVDQDSKAFKSLAKESAETRIKIAELVVQQKELRKEFAQNIVAKDSLAGLRIEYGRLIDQVTKLNAADRQSSLGQNLIKNAKGVKNQIDSIEQSMGRFTGQVGNYQKSVVKLGDLVTGGLITGGIFALVQGIGRLGSKVIDINSQISDSIADVAKAADISIESVNALADSLEKRDTRTSLLDQLDIAKIGGQLGVAEQDLFGFVEAIDVVGVALGDQFGGSVEKTAETVAKLRNVFTDIKTDNIGKDITQIGNALNFLEAQGVASAGSIADFSARIGGIGTTLGISAGKILGVSTTLSELNVNAERGSTGFIKLLQRVSQSPAEFAKAAGVASDEFTKLVNEDLFGSVELFLSKLNDKNLSNTELASVLNALKVRGVGVTEVVSKLGSNMSLLNTRVSQATKSLKESDSVTQEFEKKNLTLGASVDMLSNAFNNLLTNSALGGGISSLIRGLADLINELSGATDKLFDFTAASSGASVASDILADSVNDAREQIEKGSIATERNFNILRNGEATTQQRNKAINDLVKLYPDLLTQQQLESANITQLNGLQELATGVLRRQITERLKLRAKEQTETEIIQKKLRLVELDATPDRALLGELTAGETLRNFGTIDPKKLRTQLRNQFNSDIVELEFGLTKIEDRFNRLRVAGEDALSASEQDALDRFRQFNEGGAAVATTLKTTSEGSAKLGDEIEKLGKKSKKSKEDIDFAADSLEGLRRKVKAAQEALERAPQVKGSFIPGASGNLNPALLSALKAAEAELKKLEDELKLAKEAGVTKIPGIDELRQNAKVLGGDGGGVRGELSDAQRIKIIENNELVLNDEEYTTDQIAQFYKDLAALRIGLTKEELDEEKKAEQERQSIRQQAKETAFNSAQVVASAIFDIRRNRIDQERDQELSNLEEVYAKRLEAAQGNSVLEAKIKKELETKKAAIEKEAAAKRKKAAISEAIINTAIAITKSLTGAVFPLNLILAAGAAIAGAAQIATINSQKFERGGVARLKSGTFGGRPHSAGGTKGRFDDGTNIEVEADEIFVILNKRASRALRRFSDLNYQYGGNKFAGGGALDFTPQISLPPSGTGSSQPIVIVAQATFTDEQMDLLATKVATKTGESSKVAISEGLNDADRLAERNAALTENRSA